MKRNEQKIPDGARYWMEQRRQSGLKRGDSQDLIDSTVFNSGEMYSVAIFRERYVHSYPGQSVGSLDIDDNLFLDVLNSLDSLTEGNWEANGMTPIYSIVHLELLLEKHPEQLIFSEGVNREITLETLHHALKMWKAKK